MSCDCNCDEQRFDVGLNRNFSFVSQLNEAYRVRIASGSSAIKKRASFPYPLRPPPVTRNRPSCPGSSLPAHMRNLKTMTSPPARYATIVRLCMRDRHTFYRRQVRTTDTFELRDPCYSIPLSQSADLPCQRPTQTSPDREEFLSGTITADGSASVRVQNHSTSDIRLSYDAQSICLSLSPYALVENYCRRNRV
jgi:hypothetical protein